MFSLNELLLQREVVRGVFSIDDGEFVEVDWTNFSGWGHDNGVTICEVGSSPWYSDDSVRHERGPFKTASLRWRQSGCCDFL